MSRCIFGVAVLLAVVLLANCTISEKARFDNYRVYSLEVDNDEQLTLLRQLENTDRYEFWRSPTYIGRNVDVMVAPHQAADFSELLDGSNIKKNLMIENVQL